MPALVSYWEGANLHFPLNQYTFTLSEQASVHFEPETCWTYALQPWG
jgi:hypothetical protein